MFMNSVFPWIFRCLICLHVYCLLIIPFVLTPCKFFLISVVITLCLLILAKEMRLLNLISTLAVISLGFNVMPLVHTAQRLVDWMITITNLMFVLFRSNVLMNFTCICSLVNSYINPTTMLWTVSNHCVPHSTR